MVADIYNIILADDDEDDRMFFKDALDEISFNASVNTVNNGVQLMDFLESNPANFPDVLFLDLNMPRKTGLECLSEIKQNEKLKQLPVIIYSTSANPEVMDLLYNQGAHYYIRKPGNFANLKSVITKVLSMGRRNNFVQPSKENFLVHP